MVQDNIIAFFSDSGTDKFMVAQSIFPAWSLPSPEFNAFNGVKYLCHTLKYFERPTIKEFLINKVLFFFK